MALSFPVVPRLSRLNGGAEVVVSSNALITLGPFVHGAKPVVVVHAVDTAGNSGPPITVTWEVDLQSPVTSWLSTPAPYTSFRQAEFSFGCSDLACRFEYSLDRGPWTRLGGGGSSGSSTNLTALANVVDTAFVVQWVPGAASQPRLLGAGFSLGFQVGVIRLGANTTVRAAGVGNATVEVKLDEGTWMDVRVVPGVAWLPAPSTLLSFTVTAAGWGVGEGRHTVYARGVTEDQQADPTPAGFEFVGALRYVCMCGGGRARGGAL